MHILAIYQPTLRDSSGAAFEIESQNLQQLVASKADIIRRRYKLYITLADGRFLALLVANCLKHLTARPRVDEPFSVNLMQNRTFL